MEVAGENVFNLEDASAIEEASAPAVALDLVTRQKSLESPTSKASIARTGTKSIHME